MKERGLPSVSLIISYKNQGKPLGLTKQSRTELRKKCRQNFIGYYALIYGEDKKEYNFDCDIDFEKEHNTGLTSKLKIVGTKRHTETLKESQKKLENIFVKCKDEKERSKHEIRNIKGKIKKIKNSKWYSIYKNENIFIEIISKGDARKITTSFLKTDKENRLWENITKSTLSFFRNSNKEKYISCYLVEINPSNEEKDEYLKDLMNMLP